MPIAAVAASTIRFHLATRWGETDIKVERKNNMSHVLGEDWLEGITEKLQNLINERRNIPEISDQKMHYWAIFFYEISNAPQ